MCVVEGGHLAGQPRLASFDTPGALLGTGGMLLLIYALVKAPDTGWGSDATIGELARAGALFAALTATDASQVLGIAGFYAAFFLVTLYMQEILHFSALRAGSAYLPLTVIIAVGSIGAPG
jgi:hypothetical protein